MMAEIKMRYQVFPSHNGQDKGAVEPLNATFDENLKDFTIFAQRFAAKGDDKGYESWLFERRGQGARQGPVAAECKLDAFVFLFAFSGARGS
jgi:hypothetical protein